MTPSATEIRVLDAAKSCCERWGIAKVTIDDIAAEAGVSRATLYRMFPGGKDVLFDALRVRELEDFFTRLTASLDGADRPRGPAGAHASCSPRTSCAPTTTSRSMLASEPGDTLEQPHRRRAAADHPHGSAVPRPAGRAVPRRARRRRAWSSCWPASSSPTSSPRPSTSTSATPTRPDTSSAPTSSRRSRRRRPATGAHS